jgi:adenylyltransferase/sulfurtransferase
MTLSLDATQLDRYSRHIIMDEVGPEGQERLLSSRVVVVGAGGLGSPVIQYLAAVERSNLQRQVIHHDEDVGVPKAESAAAFVRNLNPDVTVDPLTERVDKSNVYDVVEGADVVVDASDNFPTRYLLNDVCQFEEIPLAHGAIYKFEGQATTLVPEGPCYRCLFPEAPEPGTVPDCATTGVLGVLPGTVGCIQATEAVKVLLDAGEVLEGRLMFYDAMDMTFETVPYRKNPECPVCGEGGVDSIDDIDYVESCAISLD